MASKNAIPFYSEPLIRHPASMMIFCLPTKQSPNWMQRGQFMWTLPFAHIFPKHIDGENSRIFSGDFHKSPIFTFFPQDRKMKLIEKFQEMEMYVLYPLQLSKQM